MAAPAAFRRLCDRASLSLVSTLTNGQCFGWRNISLPDAAAAASSSSSSSASSSSSSASSSSSSSAAVAAPPSPPPASTFVGVLGDAVVTLREAGDAVEYAVHNRAATAAQHAALRDYFQLDCVPSMGALCQTWAAADARLAAIALVLPGMRVLRQDPVECLFSFICSSNNHVARIGSMLARLREAYGQHLLSAPGGGAHHAFPTLEALAGADEAALRALGLGYRARFVREAAAQVLAAGGLPWLLGLRAQPRAGVQAALCALMGVGPKVADCVALFSLDQADIVPVDTHVWTIATRHYDPDGRLAASKSLTPAVYERVGDAFRARFGSHAGWAHCLLFAAELPAHRDKLPPQLVADQAASRAAERAAKAVKKAAAAARKAAKGGRAAAAAAAAGEEGGEDVDSPPVAAGEDGADRAAAAGAEPAAAAAPAAAVVVVPAVAAPAAAAPAAAAATGDGSSRKRRRGAGAAAQR